MTAPPTSGHPSNAELLAPRLHIVLSPHYDDLALSIGATMARVAASGRDVLDLIVFGTDPTGLPLHDFARHHHDAWGVTASAAIAARKREEATAVAILGATSGNLPFHDAIYRDTFYTSEESLFGVPAAAESGLPLSIADEAATVARSMAGAGHEPSDGSVRFYAPLAVGHHVDHQLAFQAGRTLAALGYVVWFYEDLPYALIGSNLPDRLAEIDASGHRIEIAVSVPTDAFWDRKIDSVLAYPSQLETVFGNYCGIPASRPAISDALAAYHRDAGAGEQAERFWRFSRP